MKWSFSIFIICMIMALAGCQNNSTDKQSDDSTGQSSTLPPETNYVMENNVNEPIKNPETNVPVLIDTTVNQMTTTAVDSAVPYLVDTISKK